MQTFINIVRARPGRRARVIACSADPLLVADVAARILEEKELGVDLDPEIDPVADLADGGVRDALRHLAGIGSGAGTEPTGGHHAGRP